MNRTIVDMKKLAAAGLRLFAKPPAGFSYPCELMRFLAPYLAVERLRDDMWSLFQSLNVDGRGHRQVQIARKSSDFDGWVDDQAFLHLLLSGLAIKEWLEENGSTVFVDANMCRLLKMTDAMTGIRCCDLRPSIPFGYYKLREEDAFIIDGARFTDCLMVCRDDSPNEKDAYYSVIWFGSDKAVPIASIIDLNKDTPVAENIARDNCAPDFLQLFHTQADRDAFAKMREFSVNLVLMAQSYPSYFTKMEGNDRPISYKGKEKKPHSFVLARSPVKKLVPKIYQKDKNIEGETHESPRSHWRRGHWRRQPHGDQWVIENPNAQGLTFPDGRRYHMKWIEPVLVEGDAITTEEQTEATA